MSDQAGIMALVLAAINDESTKARLAQIKAEMDQLEEARAKIEAMRGETDQGVAEMAAFRRNAQTWENALAEREQKLKEQTQQMAAVIEAHSADQREWQRQRTAHEEAHAAREKALREGEAADEARAGELANKAADLALREQIVTERDALHARRTEAIRAALSVT